MAGTPLLYLAQPIVLAIWISGYTGLAARRLQAGAIVPEVQLAVFIAWTALVVATPAATSSPRPCSPRCCPPTGQCTGPPAGAACTS